MQNTINLKKSTKEKIELMLQAQHKSTSYQIHSMTLVEELVQMFGCDTHHTAHICASVTSIPHVTHAHHEMVGTQARMGAPQRIESCHEGRLKPDRGT
jgi:hypothetical protein